MELDNLCSMEEDWCRGRTFLFGLFLKIKSEIRGKEVGYLIFSNQFSCIDLWNWLTFIYSKNYLIFGFGDVYHQATSIKNGDRERLIKIKTSLDEMDVAWKKQGSSVTASMLVKTKQMKKSQTEISWPEHEVRLNDSPVI